MAGYQTARGSAPAESIEEFMERRRREVGCFGQDTEAMGRPAWGLATRTGRDVSAATPQALMALGARVLGQQQTPAPSPHATTSGSLRSSGPATSRAGAPAPTASYGVLQAYQPRPDEMADLRRQQAEFAKSQRAVDKQFNWMAVPALAPVATVMALEGAAALGARLVVPELDSAPLQFVERDPYLRVGDNWATRAGRRAHQALRERLEQKPGWNYEPKVKASSGRTLKPDVGAPIRNPTPQNPEARFQMELKPNTPSGRQAAARAAKRYEQATKNKTRPIYYDPKDFI